MKKRHRVVIVGAGFGGLSVVKGLKGALVDVTVIDQRNHHLFQPLLYQVATASLAPSEIAWPIRSMLRNRRDITTVLATVIGVDMAGQAVLLADGDRVPYDTLVLATGARHGYFGHDEWEAFAPGLKTIEDATAIRGHILAAFEEAEREQDPARQQALLTFAIVGAGPTGVELAGTIADLAHDTLPCDFRAIDTRRTRVLLVEAGPTVLNGYPAKLSTYAEHALGKLGVEISLGAPVTQIEEGAITFGEHRVEARTIIWAAGVRASSAAEWLGVAADRNGRMIVEPDLSVPGHRAVFALGDTVAISAPDGSAVPGIAPAAKQEGAYVAKAIRRRLAGYAGQTPFRYRHQGSLAQIGKRKAIADFGWIKLRGAPAWWLWGLAHIYFLVSVRARLGVVLNWLWIYTRNQRAARLITRPAREAALD
ncbi:NAD(P)/FAD-dependent oxidoreductase [Sphingomonas panacisoli]|uniref:NADH:ubiquinone reductase (non-electrogenic) n=2 Tax=Sphingomonas panacisoli TaxID=1813879 RepID=A0A5B8LLD5_9SPHN|nr:NAD(P)/FAD-dependent oxidoreductase [Sphingomonas panacisoli]